MCVVDAAVLLEAKWDRFTHEVWVTVVPPKEVSNHVMILDSLVIPVGSTSHCGKRRHHRRSS